MKLKIPTIFATSIMVAGLLTACSSQTWLSRGFTVDTTITGVTEAEVASKVRDFLEKRGFSDMGKGGRDEIKRTRNSYYYEGPNSLVVVLSVDRQRVVPIRISQDSKSFSPEANRLFEDLATSFEREWPGSVTKEDMPTK